MLVLLTAAVLVAAIGVGATITDCDDNARDMSAGDAVVLMVAPRVIMAVGECARCDMAMAGDAARSVSTCCLKSASPVPSRKAAIPTRRRADTRVSKEERVLATCA